ncbi:MAG: hypothetical protein DRO89_01715, partial [Candidatus Altiarchaeales archaeon]
KLHEETKPFNREILGISYGKIFIFIFQQYINKMGIKSFFCGKKIDVPEDVKKELIPGEKVLHAVRQARIEQLFTPDSIIVTTERVMVRRPKLFGFTATNKDFRYSDMGNVIVHRGILNSTIAIKMRFLSHDLMLRAIPNDEAQAISSTIQEGIDGRFEGMDGEESRRYRISGMENRKEGADEDLLKILKLRYVKGEITREEYERMKRDIME